MNCDRRKATLRALSLLEMLVALMIVLILVAVFYPTIESIFRRNPVTNTVSKARQLQLATMTMSLDSFAAGKGPSWAFDEKTHRAESLASFGSNLVTGRYLLSTDVPKLLSDQGIRASYPLSQTNIAYKIYPVSESDKANTIFITTRNWTPYVPLDPSARPYGNKLFIVIRKDGDGAIYKAVQATNSNFTGVMTTNAGGVPLS